MTPKTEPTTFPCTLRRPDMSFSWPTRAVNPPDAAPTNWLAKIARNIPIISPR